MALRLFLIAAIIAGFVWATPVEEVGDNSIGGCWLVPRKMGFSIGMGTMSHNAYSMRGSASVLLATNYYTIIELDTSGVLYTMGLGNADSTYYDTTGSAACGTDVDTTCLYLDGYVGETMYVDAFFKGTAACTLMVTVEQALRFNADLYGWGFKEWGFYVTDTLFAETDAIPHDSLFIPVCCSTDSTRHFRDTFTLNKPGFRMRFCNLDAADAELIIDSVFVELYARHSTEIMSGVSGRLTQELEMKLKPLRGRLGQ